MEEKVHRLHRHHYHHRLVRRRRQQHRCQRSLRRHIQDCMAQ